MPWVRLLGLACLTENQPVSLPDFKVVNVGYGAGDTSFPPSCAPRHSVMASKSSAPSIDRDAPKTAVGAPKK